MFPEFVEMLSALSDAGARFLVVGGYAVSVHHEPRATKDLDILVAHDRANARRVLQALEAFGAPRMGLTLADLSSPELIFQIGVPPRRIDLLTSITGVDFEKAWAERVEARLVGLERPVPIIGRAALITNKRAVARPQDLVDVAALEGATSRVVPAKSAKKKVAKKKA